MKLKVKDKNGKTPLDLAAEQGHAQALGKISQLIRDYSNMKNLGYDGSPNKDEDYLKGDSDFSDFTDDFSDDFMKIDEISDDFQENQNYRAR